MYTTTVHNTSVHLPSAELDLFDFNPRRHRTISFQLKWQTQIKCLLLIGVSQLHLLAASIIILMKIDCTAFSQLCVSMPPAVLIYGGRNSRFKTKFLTSSVLVLSTMGVGGNCLKPRSKMLWRCCQFATELPFVCLFHCLTSS